MSEKDGAGGWEGVIIVQIGKDGELVRGTKAKHWVKDKLVSSLWKTDKREREKMETKETNDSPWRGGRREKGKKWEIAS